MGVIRSIIMAFSLFSTVPMPRIEWRPESMRYLLAAFPLVGALIGLALWGWLSLCAALGANQFVAAAGVALVPLAITGGIHLDGFCDVVDAQASHAAPERKREILKDPHIGAFAAIAAGAYLLAYCALATEIVPPTGTFPSTRLVVLLCAVHLLARTGSGIASTSFEKSNGKGMLALEQDSARKRPVLAVLGTVTAAVLCCCAACQPAAGIALAAVWTASLPALKRFANRNFGGMSGDVAGFYLQCAELAFIAVLAIVRLVA